MLGKHFAPSSTPARVLFTFEEKGELWWPAFPMCMWTQSTYLVLPWVGMSPHTHAYEWRAAIGRV
jgi:hypothetical protein